MTLSIVEEISCPECGHINNFKRYMSINVTHEPELKQKVFDKSLFLMTCEACNCVAQYEYDTLYNDQDKNLMIQLYAGNQPIEMEFYELLNSKAADIRRATGLDYSFRIVKTVDRLMETILIYDFGLDDRIVAMARYIMRTKREENIFFNSIDGESLVFEIHIEGMECVLVNIEFGLYPQLEKIYGNIIKSQNHDKCLLVDDDWAEQIKNQAGDEDYGDEDEYDDEGDYDDEDYDDENDYDDLASSLDEFGSSIDELGSSMDNLNSNLKGLASTLTNWNNEYGDEDDDDEYDDEEEENDEGSNKSRFNFLPENVCTSGSGPYEESTFDEIMKKMGVACYNLGASDVIILGRQAWDEDKLEECLESYRGCALRIYSQEMFLAYAVTQEDPYDNESLLLELGNDHPALQSILDWGFDWPTTNIVPGRDDIEETDWPQEGLLSVMGYHVGGSGIGVYSRHEILDSIMLKHVPNVQSPEYMQEWGEPKTGTRLKKLANTIASFVRNAKRRTNPPEEAIDDWKNDLAWLKEKYYNNRYRFRWPKI